MEKALKIFILIAVLFLCGSGCAPATGSTAVFEPSSCPFELPEGVVEGENVVCGFVVVPEDHNQPEGSTIRLALVVVKDRSKNHQPDPVILLTGGPGEKTVKNAVDLTQILSPMHPNRDLIIFDQRGVGLSNPALECPEMVQKILETLDEPDLDITRRVNFEAMLECRDRLVREGHNLSVFNTTQNAADVESIRIAFNYDEINLYGGSYGSLLAQEIMRNHPNHVRSVVINSVLPREKSIFIEGSGTVADAILRLLDACEADERCNQAYPDLKEGLFASINELNEAPEMVTITHPETGQTYDAVLTGDTVVNLIAVFLYKTNIIPVLPQAVYEIREGKTELMTQLLSRRLEMMDLTTRGMTLSVLCQEDLVGKTPDDLLAVQAGLPKELFGDVEPETLKAYGPFGICDSWPVEQVDPIFKEPLRSDIPTLIFSGEFDPVTPPSYGQLVSETLPNSYVYEIPGAGHDVLISSECALDVSQDFIQTPWDAPDTRCLDRLEKVAFDLPVESYEIVLESFKDEGRNLKGILPAGWKEVVPLNYMRRLNALDPTLFVQDVVLKTADELLSNLAFQLGFEPELEPESGKVLGSFEWDFYSFTIRGYQADLALTEDEDRAYFVLLICDPEEEARLREELFVKAVEGLAPLE